MFIFVRLTHVLCYLTINKLISISRHVHHGGLCGYFPGTPRKIRADFYAFLHFLVARAGLELFPGCTPIPCHLYGYLWIDLGEYSMLDQAAKSSSRNERNCN